MEVTDIVGKLLAVAEKNAGVWSVKVVKEKAKASKAFNLLSVYRHFHNHGEDKVIAWKVEDSTEYHLLAAKVLTWSDLIAVLDQLTGIDLRECMMQAIINFLLKEHHGYDIGSKHPQRMILFYIPGIFQRNVKVI